jgi:pimeloyl-ACP methyl ester carboxylesterase
MKDSRATRMFVCVALALLAVLTLAACGGSSATTTSPSPAPSEAAVTASPTPSWTPTMSPAPIPVVKPGQEPPPFSEIKTLYEYDRTEPLNTSLGIAYPKGGAILRSVAYSVNGETYAGYLTMPEGEGPFPVVIWTVGSAGNSLEWLPYAGALAKKGYAGLLLDETPGMWRDKAVSDGKALVNYAVHARRGIDVLETLPKIDATRIGFVGWSAGAQLGALLSGVDDRIKAFVLIGLTTTDTTTWSAEWKKNMEAKGGSVKGYAAQMSSFDPALYISRNAASRFLFMWGDKEGRPAPVRRWQRDAAPKYSEWRLFKGYHQYEAAFPYAYTWVEENL